MITTNISGYRFTKLYNTCTLQNDLYEICGSLNLKGSIMLSPEGINVMLAGSADAIDAFSAALDQDARLAGMAFKYSYSEHTPFQQLLIKRKHSLVPGMDTINPANDFADALPAAALKQWLDEERDFTLLDTRNDYEVELGTFDQAIDFNIQQFSQISEKLTQCDEATKAKPLVMFCTGGIRCEKAAPMAKQLGFKEVYQLEGGILTYFDECQGAHYHGDCFVFDERTVVPPSTKISKR